MEKQFEDTQQDNGKRTGYGIPEGLDSTGNVTGSSRSDRGEDPAENQITEEVINMIQRGVAESVRDMMEQDRADGSDDTAELESAAAVESAAEENDEDETYEKYCFLCHRPESQTGKMIEMPNQVCICRDCLQKAFDTMQNSGLSYQDMMNLSSGMDLAALMGQGDGEDQEEEEKKSKKKGKSGFGMPNISMINLSDLMGAIPTQQKVKKKKPKENQAPKVLDIKAIPAPHKIKAKLDDYVIGQEYAKKVISVAVYNHYKRIATNTTDEIEIEKSNMLMIGPTGSGKTYLVKTLARLLDVPLAIADATSLTEAGYIGDDIESVVSRLLAAADNDVERAEQGIVFIDEIDKIAKKKNATQRDVSGESVQQGMLKLLEGSEIEVPVGANSKNAMVPMATVNTKNILFICGGAFPGLEEIIKERLNKQASIGFLADLKDKYDKDPNILSRVTVEDIRSFGMIPEFIGRLPVVFTLQSLTKEMLVKILMEPKNAIIRQYQKLLALDEVDLQFDDGALEAIAERALDKKTGARALRAIIEEFMLDIMYEIPKDENIGSVRITREYIEHTGGPVISLRNVTPLLEQRAGQ